MAVNGCSDFIHEVLIKVEIVQGIEPVSQKFSGHEEMAQICAGEPLASVAIASFFDGTIIGRMTTVLDLQVSMASKEHSVAGIAGRDDAIEHVHAHLDPLYKVFRSAHAHQVTGEFMRKVWGQVSYDLQHGFFGLADGEAADGITIKTNLEQLFQTLLAKVEVNAALDDPEECLIRTLVNLPAALRPAHRTLHRFLNILIGGRIRRAFIETHDNVSAQLHLDAYRIFGCDQMA